MSNTQPIQFLLHQLATNEQDRNNFNQYRRAIGDPAAHSFHYNKGKADWEFQIAGQCQSSKQMTSSEHQNICTSYNHIITFIDSCLAWYEGSPVLRVFPAILKTKENNKGVHISVTLSLQRCFKNPIYHGKPLDAALSALHDKMLELVPEYREFCGEREDEMPNWEDIEGENPVRAEYLRD